MGLGRTLTALIASIVVVMTATVALASPAGDGIRLPIDTAAKAGTPNAVTVAAGDHLWKISRTYLERVIGEPADIRQVSRLWREVIAINRDRLRSGDPDLIYPGETIVMPPAG
jgi:nucleoid-associated protein YgaU